MIKKVAHIAVAVRSVDQASRFFETVLGLHCERTEVVETEKAKVAFLPVGDTEIELVEGVGKGNPLEKFLEKRGEGIHHICLEVANLDESMKQLREAGVPLLDDAPRPGADGTRVAFIHPKGAHGILIELVEVPGSGQSLNPEP
ncbi:MAG: methylmalonyl-CoA epimerase [candidate division NC10 bacterium]|nr:methylmalonyl-CoA epimerase [candidate division NC10 bacterium]